MLAAGGDIQIDEFLAAFNVQLRDAIERIGERTAAQADGGRAIVAGRRTAVVGSRAFSDRAMMKAAIEAVEPSEIVSGGAGGADTLAREIGNELGMPVEEFLADWEGHGPDAGFLRNQQIVDHADAMIAFFSPGPETPGTIDLIERARRKGIAIQILHQAPGP